MILKTFARKTHSADEHEKTLPAISTGDDVSMAAIDVHVIDAWGIEPQLRLYVERFTCDIGDEWYPIWTSEPISQPGKVSVSIGPGLAVPALLGQALRLRWEISPYAKFTFSAGMLIR